MLHTCAVIIIKWHSSRESLLPPIFHVLESFPIILYKSNDNLNTFIIYVLYHYPLCVIYIIFYNFHLIIRLKYNFHTIIWITQLILFISWNYIHINTLYSLTNTHNLTNTHTISQTHTLLINVMNCLVLCKTHFLNVNIVIEPTFCRKAKVWKNLFT